VTLVTIGEKGKDPGSADYAVTGTDLDTKDLEQLKKLVTGAVAGAQVKGPPATQRQLEAPAVYVGVVTDKLIAGGKLTATFNLKKTTGAGTGATETVTATSGALTFNVLPESPRITVSAGIGLSTAPNPTVALVKTSTIVTFTKDEKQQQAYEQVITLNDTDTTLHPVQSLMIVANFRVHWRLYASAAVRVDEKLFEQPVLGATYRHPLGDRVGVNVTAGVMFSRETEILAESGFAEGQKIDPSLGLTADEIPTTTRYHRRFALLFSFDF
jgi:hypothetical protein